MLLAKVFCNQARYTTRYHQENQRLAYLEVRQQMISQSFYAIVQSFPLITPRRLPDRLSAASALHSHLCAHRRRVHHAADLPVLPDLQLLQVSV